MGGCCSSSRPRPRPPVVPTKEHLRGVQLPQKDGISESCLRDSLKQAADHLNRQGQNITVIAAGGVLDVLQIESKHPIHDLLFFGSNLDQAQKDALKVAMSFGEKTYGAPIGKACFNSDAIREMTFDLQKDLTGSVFKDQTEDYRAIFKMPGLEILPVAILYSFLTKVDRMWTQDDRGYDFDDAIEYLYLVMHRKKVNSGAPLRAVPWSTIDRLCERYRKPRVTREKVEAINRKFRSRFRMPGIDVRN